MNNDDPKNNFLHSTTVGLGNDLVETLQQKQFCVVGCGAVGVAFAEMLVRSGATKLYLIDGDEVERKNLNRLTGFVEGDVGKKKVEVLKKYLENISPNISVQTEAYHLKKIYPGDERAKSARNLVAKSDIVVIAMDSNIARIECENLCKNATQTQYLSVGVEVDKSQELLFFECVWKPKTPEEVKDREGYGPENGSFQSIVLEATAVGFNMMLHHLQNPNSRQFTYYAKEYIHLEPIKVQLDNQSLNFQEQ